MSRLVRLLHNTAIRASGGVPSTTIRAKAAASAPPPQPVTLESDFVVILAALLCALICVVGLIAVARCAWLRGGPRGSSPTRGLANKGLKKKVLQSLPRFTYISSSNGNDNNGQNSKKWMAMLDCAICLAEFEEGDEIRVLPQCGHGFHLGCIDTWLMSHSSCPSCRQILVVARCRKCGQYPAVGSNRSVNGGGGGGGGGGSSRGVGEGEVVVITVDDKNIEGGNASGVGLRGHHPHENDTGNNNVHNSGNHNDSDNNQSYLS